jgi:hypothetical protein
MEEGELVESGLQNNLPGINTIFPAEIKGPNPWARQGLTADLGTWLMLVIPRERD